MTEQQPNDTQNGTYTPDRIAMIRVDSGQDTDDPPSYMIRPEGAQSMSDCQLWTCGDRPGEKSFCEELVRRYNNGASI